MEYISFVLHRGYKPSYNYDVIESKCFPLYYCYLLIMIDKKKTFVPCHETICEFILQLMKIYSKIFNTMYITAHIRPIAALGGQHEGVERKINLVDKCARRETTLIFHGASVIRDLHF